MWKSANVVIWKSCNVKMYKSGNVGNVAIWKYICFKFHAYFEMGNGRHNLKIVCTHFILRTTDPVSSTLNLSQCNAMSA